MEFSLYGKPPSSAAITSIRLERREPARNRLRFYNIAVTRTLFDGWAVVREWGRIGQPGTVRETWFETESAAIEAGGASAEGKARVSGGGRAFAWVRHFVYCSRYGSASDSRACWRPAAEHRTEDPILSYVWFLRHVCISSAKSV